MHVQDLADLYSKVLWATRHDREAQAISRRMGDRVRQTLTKHSILQYVHMLLTRFNAFAIRRAQLRVTPN